MGTDSKQTKLTPGFGWRKPATCRRSGAPKREADRNVRAPVVIGIAGGSGSGKSWLAGLLSNALGRRATALKLDSFYRDRSHLSLARRASLNFDDPKAIDWGAFERALRALASGRAASIPCYDFATHSRSGRCVVGPRPVVIVDGLWVARRVSVRRMLDLIVFMDCPASVRLKRRVERDIRDRGRTPGSVRRQFECTVEPMHRRYVEPQRRWADVIVRPGGSQWAVRWIVRWVGNGRKEAQKSQKERGRDTKGQ